jgi:hypothetical protein
MPGLTVAEKNHWRDRIASKIEKAAERIRARNPALFDRLTREAHAHALNSLGLADAHAELEAIRADEADLARRKKLAQRSMIATLRSVPIDEVGDSYSVRYGNELALPQEVAEAIARRQAAHHEQLLAGDPTGREVARLQAEKDRLLDTIWLAVSPDQIRQLWTRVGELLGDEATTLERQAPAIEPAEET